MLLDVLSSAWNTEVRYFYYVIRNPLQQNNVTPDSENKGSDFMLLHFGRIKNNLDALLYEGNLAVTGMPSLLRHGC
jgi:hypothetical protein